MGLIQRFKDYRTNKRLERLTGDLEMIRNRINFNPKYAFNLDNIDNDAAFTRRIEEYRVWYSGNSRALRQLYHSNVRKESLNYFWYKVPENLRMIHSGIPALISSKMATILFGGGLDVELTVYGENGEVDESKTQEAQEHFDFLRGKLRIDELLEKAAELESPFGHIFFKFSHDVSLSDYPILEIADLRNAETVKKRGITIAQIFKYWYKHKNKNYRLDEIYTTNELDEAIIRYELYAFNAGKEVRVPLDEIPETEILLYDANGDKRLNENDEFVFSGLKGALAFDKPNKLPSHEFPDSHYGASDYEGALDSFDALDEAYTELIAELRSNKSKTHIPESMIPKIPVKMRDGSIVMESVELDPFVTNYIKVADDLDQDGRQEITTTIIPDKSDEHLIKYRTALTTSINMAGLSAFALGITGLESIASSAESQQERNKVTLETRAKKLKLWKLSLEAVFKQLMIYNVWMRKNTNAQQDELSELDINFNNLEVNVAFGDYIIERQSDLINIWGGAIQLGVASRETAIRNIQTDWNDEKVLEEVNRIRFEEGMGLDNPNNLPELTGLTDDEDDELEDLQSEVD